MITQIEELDKRRCKIYMNHKPVFVLYKGEVTQYKLREEEVIKESVYDEIIKQVLPLRAKKRCLNLLQKRPYTEWKLREKLKEGFYPQEIIDEAIDYMKSFHYIDDYEYASQYVFYHKDSESRKKMEEKLSIKGIDKEILKRVFIDSYQDEEEMMELELQQAKKFLEKKGYDAQAMEWKEKQKIFAYLLRKGLRTSVIKEAMRLQEEITI